MSTARRETDLARAMQISKQAVEKIFIKTKQRQIRKFNCLTPDRHRTRTIPKKIKLMTYEADM